MSTLPTEFATKKMSGGVRGVRRNRESGGGQRKAGVQKHSGEPEPGEKHLLLLVCVKWKVLGGDAVGAGWVSVIEELAAQPRWKTCFTR